MEARKQSKLTYSELSQLQQNLQELLLALRRNNFKAGVDQYLSAQALFLHWQKVPLTATELSASLCALFSSTSDEQQRFYSIFENWYQHYTEPTSSQTRKKEQLSKAPDWSKTPRISGRVRLFAALVFLVVTIIIVQSNEPIVETVPVPETIAKIEDKKAPKEKVTPIDSKNQQFIPAPHFPAEPIIAPASYRHWSDRLQHIQWLPFMGFMIWLFLRCYQRYLTLSRQSRQKQAVVRLESLRLKQSSIDLFPIPILKQVFRAWRKYLPFRSHRLNESATVEKTLQHNGYINVVYKQRLLPPEHVLLIDRRHVDDYVTRLSEELQQRMQQEGLFVSSYHYDSDPRYCRPQNGADACFSLAQLADRHQGQSLLVIGNATAFYRGRNASQIEWGNDAWKNKTLLSINTPEDWGGQETKLITAGFKITPFTRRGLLQLITELDSGSAEQSIEQARSLDYRDASLPSALRDYAADWLEEQKLDRKQQKNSLSALKNYLGYEGYRLLAAIAAYPTLDWRLTLALDAQLQQKSGEEREIRLRKISRLPWLRAGRLPDVWRKRLIRSLNKPMLRQINEAYQALLNVQDNEVMELPIAIPDYKAAKQAQNQQIHTAKQGEPLQDTVFASVIRGRKPSLLEFNLPRQMQHWLPPQYWRGLLGPALLALLMAGGFNLGIKQAWQNWGLNQQTELALQTMQTELAAYEVELKYSNEKLKFHAQTLQNRLQNWGLKATVEFDELDKAAKKTANINQIRAHPSLSNRVIQLLKQRLQYLTYAAEVNQSKDDSLDETQLVIDLNQAYQPLAVTQDAIQDSLLTHTKRDKLKDGSLAPAMVKIEPGCFEMGSDESYQDSDILQLLIDAQKPQHTVCIKKSFFMGKYEVTFAEYDKFPNNIMRELPDKGWSHGKHPVTNISWDNAVAYSQWLSVQTGKKYRLPTEAEWEYVARAGAKTQYWWGDSIENGMALCGECGSRWDGISTAPVGSFTYNTFRLYDTAGNVSEWVQDCWHENYKNAPVEGSSWESSEKENCGLRIVRGSSWYNFARGLRSADRVRSWPSTRIKSIGFRLAQD